MLCVSLGKTTPEEIGVWSEQSELVEVRLDLNSFSEREIERIFGNSDNLIATCRKNSIGNGDRKKFLEVAILSGAKFIDFDPSSDNDFMDDLMAEARRSGCQTIVSYHNYSTTPSVNKLNGIYETLVERGGDIIKVACMVNTEEDIITVLSMYKPEREIVSIGMGKMGRITRVVGYFLGSPIVYTSSGKGDTASGQIRYHDLRKIIKEISDG